MRRTLALVDDDPAFSEYLTQYLCDRGIAARWFADSDDLLCSEGPFDYDFYVLDLMLPGIDGLSLLRLLRKRSHAGVLVVSGMAAATAFDQVIVAGAEMHLAKPVSFEHVLLAIGRVYRRSATPPPAAVPWRQDAARALLLSPEGAPIDLSPTNLRVLACLLDAGGNTVSRETLAARLGRAPDDDPNLLNATIYRLRRRIERATQALSPLQARSRRA
ncbi:MAG: response regulator [Rubrivivax sp.]|nr:response regulator [Rubrivivax sp.]